LNPAQKSVLRVAARKMLRAQGEKITARQRSMVVDHGCHGFPRKRLKRGGGAGHTMAPAGLPSKSEISFSTANRLCFIFLTHQKSSQKSPRGTLNEAA